MRVQRVTPIVSSKGSRKTATSNKPSSLAESMKQSLGNKIKAIHDRMTSEESGIDSDRKDVDKED